jgi:hypothetical protein
MTRHRPSANEIRYLISTSVENGISRTVFLVVKPDAEAKTYDRSEDKYVDYHF